MAYKTSELYKEAIEKATRTTFISGFLTLSNGQQIEINDKSTGQGSLYITNQCVSSDAFSYGSVFSAEMGMSIRSDIDRYSLLGAEIKPYFNLKLNDGTIETIPLGKFYVSEPNRVGKNISIKAYDGMILFEQDIFENTTGTAFELLSWACSKCGVEMSQTEAEIKSLPNGTVLLSVEPTRISTYRDLISFIGIITCTFAIFDRDGKLKLCSFSDKVTKVISARQRISSKFSDFQTYYSAISGNFIAAGAYKAYMQTNEDNANGLVYKTGEVPIVQGTDLSNQNVIDKMFDNLLVINYTPCDISFSGDPSIDLGDMIVNVDLYGNEITSLVTFYKWTYRGRQQIKSAGANPKIGEAKDKAQKELEQLTANIMLKDIAVYAYTNANLISVQGGTEEVKTQKEVVKISFAVNADVTSIITTTVTFDMSVQGCVEFSMYLDSVLQEGSTVSHHCLKGPNTITFANYIPCEQGKTYRVSIYARTFKLNEEDTLSTMTIKQNGVRSMIFGQGVATEVPWDGNLTFVDILPEVFNLETKQISVIKSVQDSIDAKLYYPETSNMTESLSKIKIVKKTINVENFSYKKASDFTWDELQSKTWDTMLAYSWGKEE